MTQEKSLNKKNGPIVTPAFLKHTVKNSWAVTLLIFIVMLLISTVPLMIEVDNINVSNYAGSMYEIDELHRRLGNDLEVTAGTMIVISCISALLTGCYSLMFLHNKVSVGFFHSLPEKRSGHYITALVSAVTSYIVPLIINFVIMILSIGAYGLLDGFAFSFLMKIILLSVFYYLVFLSITFFAGFLTGSSVIQAIFSAYIIAVLPVIYYSVLIWLDQSLSYLQIGELADLTSVVSALSPAARIFTVAEVFNNPISVRSIIYLVLDTILTVIFFIGAYAVYKKRPVELAGTPVIYKPLSEAIKYTIIFASSLLLGYLFSEIGGALWLIFGLAAGALLSFMLCNTVLNRTAKAMFSGVKGFLLSAVVIIFVFIYAATGGFGILDYIVPAANSVTVQLDGINFVLTDKAEVSEFRRLMDELTDELKNGDIETGDYIYEKEYVVNVYDEEALKSSTAIVNTDTLAMAEGNRRKLTLYVTYHTPYGLDVPYRYYSIPYEHLTEILDLIKSSKDYSKFTTYAAGENFELSYVHLSVECVPYESNYANTTAIDIDPSAEKTEMSTNGWSGIPTISIEFSDFIADKYVSELMDKEQLRAELKPMYDAFCNYLNSRKTKDHNEPAIGYMRFDAGGQIYADPEVYEIIQRENYSSSSYVDYYYYGNNCPLYAEDIEILFDILGPFANYIHIYVNDGYGLHYELYTKEEQEELIDLLMYSSVDDYIDAVTEQVDYILVADHKNGVVTKFEGKNEIREILSASVRIDDSAEVSAFTKTDTDYNVFVVVEENVQHFHTYFREGMTPAFIK